MSEPRFTPGPWRYDDITDVVGPDDRTIASLWAPDGDPYAGDVAIADANARLIAAAPEMFEALQAMLDRYGMHSNEAVKMAADALTKALGETDTLGSEEAEYG